MAFFKNLLDTFTSSEKRNIKFYIIGIMFYKFGLEAFIGPISLMAQDRFDKETALKSLGVLLAINQSMQCVGSILIAPLMARYPVKTVLSIAIWLFAILVSVGLILEISTGGRIPKNENDDNYHGYWEIDILYPLYGLVGVCHGMVEVIRRVIPQDIVGGSVKKLKRMDSLVHICYEIAGTAGAFFSAFLILKLGNGYAPSITPFLFLCAGLIWFLIRIPQPIVIDDIETIKRKSWDQQSKNSTSFDKSKANNNNGGILSQINQGFIDFAASVYQGGYIVLTNRRFSWLITGYSLPLVLHRYLESQLSPIFAKNILGSGHYAQILVGGSNLGELGGAFFVLLFTELIKTPLPWVRLDALTLAITWMLPLAQPENSETFAWLAAGVFVFVSGGWAAGDVSLAAYIQSSLSKMEIKGNRKISPLAAVMAFLYSSYIIIYAIASPILGQFFDRYAGNTREGLFWVAGVGYSVCGVIIFLSTFIPKGSFALNPDLDPLDEVDEVDEHHRGDEIVEESKITSTSTIVSDDHKIIAPEKALTKQIADI